MEMEVRDLWGQKVETYEILHPVTDEPWDMLRAFANYLESNQIKGIVESVTTKSSIDEDEFSSVLLISRID